MPYNSSSEERKREREKKAYQQRQRDLWKQEDERNYILQQIEKKEKERVAEERRLWNERRIRREEKRRQHEIESKNSALLAGMHRILEEVLQTNDVKRAELRDKWNKEDELFWAEFWAADAKRAAEYKKRKALEATKDEVLVDISHDHVVSEEIIVEYHAPPIEALDDVHDAYIDSVVQFEELTCPIMEEVVPHEEALVVVHADQVIDVEYHDPPAEHVDFSSQVHDSCDELVQISVAPISSVGEVEKEAKSAGSIEQLKEIQATNLYYDPFSVHYIPLDFVIADFYALELKLYKRMITVLFTSFILLDIVHCEGLLTFVRPRLLFDPGRMTWPGRPMFYPFIAVGLRSEDRSFRTGRE